VKLRRGLRDNQSRRGVLRRRGHENGLAVRTLHCSVEGLFANADGFAALRAGKLNEHDGCAGGKGLWYIVNTPIMVVPSRPDKRGAVVETMMVTPTP
jgi:hypothetical protein